MCSYKKKGASILLEIMNYLEKNLIIEIMKLLYNVEPLITILGGIVLSIILWIFVRPPKLKSKKIIPPAICIIMLLLVGGGYYARKTYTYIPQIYWGEG